ncbi:MAG: hypothetical protein M0Z27_08205 [Thermaerobacter sp.]|nr:hypothetical protein [Thermaerobacter sp.]
MSRLTSAAEAFRSLSEGGQNPWVAIGDFLDDFRRAAGDEERASLVVTPLPLAGTPDACRWAAFLAGAVSILCRREGMPIPAWTAREEYVLDQPWFLYRGMRLRAWQLATTPGPFKARNVFCGDRALERV